MPLIYTHRYSSIQIHSMKVHTHSALWAVADICPDISDLKQEMTVIPERQSLSGIKHNKGWRRGSVALAIGNSACSPSLIRRQLFSPALAQLSQWFNYSNKNNNNASVQLWASKPFHNCGMPHVGACTCMHVCLCVCALVCMCVGGLVVKRGCQQLPDRQP